MLPKNPFFSARSAVLSPAQPRVQAPVLLTAQNPLPRVEPTQAPSDARAPAQPSDYVFTKASKSAYPLPALKRLPKVVGLIGDAPTNTSASALTSPAPAPATSAPTTAALAGSIKSRTGWRNDTEYVRILVLKKGAQAKSTVSYTLPQYTDALKYAYEDARLLHATVRAVALEVADDKDLSYSFVVRTKVLQKLKGAYRPARAEAGAKTDAEAALADANNKEWETV